MVTALATQQTEGRAPLPVPTAWLGDDARYLFAARHALAEWERRQSGDYRVPGEWIDRDFYPAHLEEIQLCCWTVNQHSMWPHAKSLFHVSNLFPLPYRVLINLVLAQHDSPRFRRIMEARTR